jgi:hypothetical protein
MPETPAEGFFGSAGNRLQKAERHLGSNDGGCLEQALLLGR